MFILYIILLFLDNNLVMCLNNVFGLLPSTHIVIKIMWIGSFIHSFIHLNEPVFFSKDYFKNNDIKYFYVKQKYYNMH